MNMRQPQPCPKDRKPADPPPPLKRDTLEYRLTDQTSFGDFAVYHSCYTLQSYLTQKCRNNCDTCLYRSSFKVCIADIAQEIMKTIEQKYGVDEGENK
jgi:hypothetical protein